MSERSRVFHSVNSDLIWEQIRDTVERDKAASGPRTSARAASMSRSDKPATHPEITSASKALVRVTSLPNSLEQNFSSVSRSFGLPIFTGPIVVLIVASGCHPLCDPAGESPVRRS
jgi:hypothetical protein